MGNKDSKNGIVESMCLTKRHDFGLDKPKGDRFKNMCCGMTDEEREVIRGEMGQIFDHHIAPLLEVNNKLLAAARSVVEAFDDLPSVSPVRMVPLNISSLRRAIALVEKDADIKSNQLLESALDLATEMHCRDNQ